MPDVETRNGIHQQEGDPTQKNLKDSKKWEENPAKEREIVEKLWPILMQNLRGNENTQESARKTLDGYHSNPREIFIQFLDKDWSGNYSYFRFPGGEETAEAVRLVNELGEILGVYEARRRKKNTDKIQSSIDSQKRELKGIKKEMEEFTKLIPNLLPFIIKDGQILEFTYKEPWKDTLEAFDSISDKKSFITQEYPGKLFVKGEEVVELNRDECELLKKIKDLEKKYEENADRYNNLIEKIQEAEKEEQAWQVASEGYIYEDE